MKSRRITVLALALAVAGVSAHAAKVFLTAEGSKETFKEISVEAQPYRQAVEKEFSVPKKILMIRKASSLATYQHYGSQIKTTTLPDDSIFNYLQETEEYYGYIPKEKFPKFAQKHLKGNKYCSEFT